METKVTVKRRYVKDGPIEMYITTDDRQASAACALCKEDFDEISFTLSLRANEIEYFIPLLDVIKNEYENILQERR